MQALWIGTLTVAFHDRDVELWLDGPIALRRDSCAARWYAKHRGIGVPDADEAQENPGTG